MAVTVMGRGSSNRMSRPIRRPRPLALRLPVPVLKRPLEVTRPRPLTPLLPCFSSKGTPRLRSHLWIPYNSSSNSSNNNNNSSRPSSSRKHYRVLLSQPVPYTIPHCQPPCRRRAKRNKSNSSTVNLLTASGLDFGRLSFSVLGLYHTRPPSQAAESAGEPPKLEYSPFMSATPQGGYEDPSHPGTGSPFEPLHPAAVTVSAVSAASTVTSPKEEPPALFASPSTPLQPVQPAPPTAGPSTSQSASGSTESGASGSGDPESTQQQQHAATLADYNQSTSKGHEILSQVKNLSENTHATSLTSYPILHRSTNKTLACRSG